MPEFPMGVHLSEAQVREGEIAQGTEGFVDGYPPVPDRQKKVFHLVGAHVASVGCAIVPELTTAQQTLALAIVAGVALIAFFVSILMAH